MRHTGPLPRLLLASASPRRADLLHGLGLRFDVVPTDADETLLPGEAPADYTLRVARAKAWAADVPEAVVLAADTAVVVDETILGKPVDADDARRMLRLLSGRDHRVVTAVAVGIRSEANPNVAAAERWSADAVDTVRVSFRELTEADIDWYVGLGEPMDKAGAYGLQGVGGLFVTHVEGNAQAVIGLSLDTVNRLLHHVGLDLRDWAGRRP